MVRHQLHQIFEAKPLMLEDRAEPLEGQVDLLRGIVRNRAVRTDPDLAGNEHEATGFYLTAPTSRSSWRTPAIRPSSTMRQS